MIWLDRVKRLWGGATGTQPESSVATEARVVPPADTDQNTITLPGVFEEEEELTYGRAFELVPSVYRAVSLLSTNMAMLPLRFFRSDDDSKEYLKPGEHPIVDKWRKPNSIETDFQFMEKLEASLDINGNGYLYVEPIKGIDGPDVDLNVLPAHLTNPVWIKGRLSHYALRWHGREIRLDKDLVIHIPLFSPAWGRKGMSPLSSAGLAFRTQRLSQRWVHALYLRGGEATGHLESETGISAEKRRRLELQLRKRNQGPEGYKNIIALPPGVKQTKTMLTPQELQFIDQYKLTKGDVYEVYGIPPWMVGIKEGGGLGDAGSRTDERLFWKNTIGPRASRISRLISERLIPLFDDTEGLECEFDFSGVEVLKLIQIEIAKEGKNVTGKSCVTVNEFRTKYLNLEPLEGEEFDTISTPDPFGFGPPPANQPPPPTVDDAQDEAARRTAWKRAHINRLTRLTRPMARVWVEIFERQENRVLATVRSADLRAVGDDFDAEQDEIALFIRAVTAIVQTQGPAALAVLGVAIDFDLTTASVQWYIRHHAQRTIVGTTETTRALLRERIAEVQAQGGGLNETAKAVREVFEQRRENALDIARTEVTPAYNFATTEAWEQSGVVEGSQWVAVDDERTREAHADADGQIVPLGQGFEVGGELLRFPGDPAGSAENVINCRCGLLAVLGAPQAGRNGHGKLPDRLAKYFAKESIARAIQSR